MIGEFAGDGFDAETHNFAIGRGALGGAINGGEYNVAVGNFTLDALTSGDQNTAVGYDAGTAVSTHSDGVFIGWKAGDNAITGGRNICIGANTDPSSNNGEGQINIGYNFSGNGDNKVALGSNDGYIWNSFTQNNTWTAVSDERTKKNIEADDLGLDFINELKPVTFNWRKADEIDPEFIKSTLNIGRGERDSEVLIHGLIAQEVKAAMDKVGNTTFNGWEEGVDGQAVSREMFITPLIKAVQELSAENEELKTRITALENA
jgi:hypothetical protein